MLYNVFLGPVSPIIHPKVDPFQFRNLRTGEVKSRISKREAYKLMNAAQAAGQPGFVDEWIRGQWEEENCNLVAYWEHLHPEDKPAA